MLPSFRPGMTTGIPFWRLQYRRSTIDGLAYAATLSHHTLVIPHYLSIMTSHFTEPPQVPAGETLALNSLFHETCFPGLPEVSHQLITTPQYPDYLTIEQAFQPDEGNIWMPKKFHLAAYSAPEGHTTHSHCSIKDLPSDWRILDCERKDDAEFHYPDAPYVKMTFLSDPDRTAITFRDSPDSVAPWMNRMCAGTITEDAKELLCFVEKDERTAYREVTDARVILSAWRSGITGVHADSYGGTSKLANVRRLLGRLGIGEKQGQGR